MSIKINSSYKFNALFDFSIGMTCEDRHSIMKFHSVKEIPNAEAEASVSFLHLTFVLNRDLVWMRPSSTSRTEVHETGVI